VEGGRGVTDRGHGDAGASLLPAVAVPDGKVDEGCTFVRLDVNDQGCTTTAVGYALVVGAATRRVVMAKSVEVHDVLLKFAGVG
jgi:hypothetical protein